VQYRENDAGRKTLTESVNSLKDRGRQTLFFIRVMHYTRMIRHDYGLTWWSIEPTTALNLTVRMIFEMLSFRIVITLFLLNTILFPAKKKSTGGETICTNRQLTNRNKSSKVFIFFIFSANASSTGYFLRRGKMITSD
jgi:hypothetical protein